MVRDYSAFLPGGTPQRQAPTALESLGRGPTFAWKIDADALARWRKLQAEDAFNSTSLAERCEKDRAFGELVRSAVKAKSDREGSFQASPTRSIPGSQPTSDASQHHVI
ncbi:hypothetical protein [Marivita sp.]|jgi:hypothetical protein|uniref:hypothetical protein n=1 Tax=Marivita sp. TaxID=2003365 RepID=UPI003F6BBCD3